MVNDVQMLLVPDDDASEKASARGLPLGDEREKYMIAQYKAGANTMDILNGLTEKFGYPGNRETLYRALERHGIQRPRPRLGHPNPNKTKITGSTVQKCKYAKQLLKDEPALLFDELASKVREHFGTGLSRDHISKLRKRFGVAGPATGERSGRFIAERRTPPEMKVMLPAPKSIETIVQDFVAAVSEEGSIERIEIDFVKGSVRVYKMDAFTINART